MTTMIHLDVRFELEYAVGSAGADFIFQFHAAHTAAQKVCQENWHITPSATAAQVQPVGDQGQRCLRVHAAPGPLLVTYQATVEITHHRADPDSLMECPVRELPVQVLPFIYPSRYCQSDLVANFAYQEFGHLPPGYARVQAINDWVRHHVRFQSNSSGPSTTAVDTLISRVGVCRDFAHLMVALCRAINIPARFATGTDYGADPALGPPDFHAYVEVYIGQRWYLFDPSGTAIRTGMVRLATGRDAADVAFASIIGAVTAQPPRIAHHALADAAQGWELPAPTSLALSTA